LFVGADLVPEEFVAGSLAQAMGASDLTGRCCLLLRSDIARQDLPKLLVEAGAVADDIALYRTCVPEAFPEIVIRDLQAGSISWATFTSSSTFVNFARLLGNEADAIIGRLELASIGPITSRTIRAAGFDPTIEAKAYTTTGLADAIAAHYASGSG
ncbi:MAG: uroporphyrinogen-III synthase, partial [bacterium]|nr:uroporphyrinogen-III synthase [bacterium]